MNRRGLVLSELLPSRALIVGALAVLATACPPNAGDGPNTDGVTSSGDSGASSEEATGTSGAGSSGEGSSGGSAGTSGSGATGGMEASSSGGASTGDAGEGSLCEAYCAKRAGCGEDPSWCPESCARNTVSYGYLGAGCLEVFESYRICILSHTCAEIAGDPYLCKELLDQAFVTDVCVTPGCAATCAKAHECSTPGEDPSHCGVDCSFALGEAAYNFGEACADAYEAAQVCVGDSTCDEFLGDMPCSDEYSAADAICDG